MKPASDKITSHDNVQLAVMANDLRYLKEGFDKLDDKISQNYVTKEELALVRADIEAVRREILPFKRGTAWLLGAVGLTIIGALFKLILK